MTINIAVSTRGLDTWHVTLAVYPLEARGRLLCPRCVILAWCLLIISRWWDPALEREGGILWQFHTLEPKLTPGQYWSSQCWTVDYWSDMARDINWNIDCVICWQATIVTHESHWHNSDHDPGELYNWQQTKGALNAQQSDVFMLWTNETNQEKKRDLYWRIVLMIKANTDITVPWL